MGKYGWILAALAVYWLFIRQPAPAQTRAIDPTGQGATPPI